MSKEAGTSIIALNRRARFNFELLEFYEGGLVLTGSEVKSIRGGNAQVNEAHAHVVGDELWLINAHIAPYINAGYTQHDARRTRKVLLHKKELLKIKQAREQKGLTLVPTKLYWKKGKVKVEIALARGKKLHDKRATLKERDWNRQKQQLMK
ncbi:MAG: SsrA-binding protein SmpB [Alphaproteobacteria bacterium]